MLLVGRCLRVRLAGVEKELWICGKRWQFWISQMTTPKARETDELTSWTDLEKLFRKSPVQMRDVWGGKKEGIEGASPTVLIKGRDVGHHGKVGASDDQSGW